MFYNYIHIHVDYLRVRQEPTEETQGTVNDTSAVTSLPQQSSVSSNNVQPTPTTASTGVCVCVCVCVCVRVRAYVRASMYVCVWVSH